jgi:hydrogenase/urease accessory protein HupE
MMGQLTLNMGLLYQWQPIVTALLPNVLAFVLALGILLGMERRFQWPAKAARQVKPRREGLA